MNCFWDFNHQNLFYHHFPSSSPHFLSFLPTCSLVLPRPSVSWWFHSLSNSFSFHYYALNPWSSSEITHHHPHAFCSLFLYTSMIHWIQLSPNHQWFNSVATSKQHGTYSAAGHHCYPDRCHKQVILKMLYP